jgi:hypothetical protein
MRTAEFTRNYKRANVILNSWSSKSTQATPTEIKTQILWSFNPYNQFPGTYIMPATETARMRGTSLLLWEGRWQHDAQKEMHAAGWRGWYIAATYFCVAVALQGQFPSAWPVPRTQTHFASGTSRPSTHNGRNVPTNKRHWSNPRN